MPLWEGLGEEKGSATVPGQPVLWTALPVTGPEESEVGDTWPNAKAQALKALWPCSSVKGEETAPNAPSCNHSL